MGEWAAHAKALAKEMKKNGDNGGTITVETASEDGTEKISTTHTKSSKKNADGTVTTKKVSSTKHVQSTLLGGATHSLPGANQHGALSAHDAAHQAHAAHHAAHEAAVKTHKRHISKRYTAGMRYLTP